MTSKNGDEFLILIYVVLTSGLLRLIFDLASDMLCRSFMLEIRHRFLLSSPMELLKNHLQSLKIIKILAAYDFLSHFCSLFGIFLHTIAALNDMDILISYSGVRAWIFV